MLHLLSSYANMIKTLFKIYGTKLQLHSRSVAVFSSFVKYYRNNEHVCQFFYKWKVNNSFSGIKLLGKYLGHTGFKQSPSFQLKYIMGYSSQIIISMCSKQLLNIKYSLSSNLNYVFVYKLLIIF